MGFFGFGQDNRVGKGRVGLRVVPRTRGEGCCYWGRGIVIAVGGGAVGGGAVVVGVRGHWFLLFGCFGVALSLWLICFL